MEAAMNGRRTALIALIAITAVVVSVSSSGAMRDDSDRTENGGAVQRCSLDGVNPIHHPKIFGNPATAAAFGFVRAPDGSWRVAPNCRR
jgi:hypothetical protein